MVDFTPPGRESINQNRLGFSQSGSNQPSTSLIEQLTQLQNITKFILDNLEDGTSHELNCRKLAGQHVYNEIVLKNPMIFSPQNSFIRDFFNEEIAANSNRGEILQGAASVLCALNELIKQQPVKSTNRIY